MGRTPTQGASLNPIWEIDDEFGCVSNQLWFDAPAKPKAHGGRPRIDWRLAINGIIFPPPLGCQWNNPRFRWTTARSIAGSSGGAATASSNESGLSCLRKFAKSSASTGLASRRRSTGQSSIRGEKVGVPRTGAKNGTKQSVLVERRRRTARGRNRRANGGS